MKYRGRLFTGITEVVLGSIVFYVAFNLLPRKPHHITTVSLSYVFIILGLWAIIGGLNNLAIELYEKMKKKQ